MMPRVFEIQALLAIYRSETMGVLDANKGRRKDLPPKLVKTEIDI